MNGKVIIGTVVLTLFFATVCVLLHWFEYGLWGLLSIPAVLVAFIISELFHELGHVVFGAFAGIKAIPKISLSGSSCCEIIPRTDKNLKKRVIITALGGIVFNAILVILGLVAFSVRQVPVWLSLPLPSSVYMIIINATPYMNKNGKTDGLVISELVKGDDNAKVALAVLTVQAQLLGGKDIKDVDEKLLFGLPVVREDEPAFISLTELRYEYKKAIGDTEQAEKLRERLEYLKKEYM